MPLTITKDVNRRAQQGDFYCTPQWATRALFRHVLEPHCGDTLLYHQSYLEPAAGDGHIASVLKEYASDKAVQATDIKQRNYELDAAFDFIHDELPENIRSHDWIITNPVSYTHLTLPTKA